MESAKRSGATKGATHLVGCEVCRWRVEQLVQELEELRQAPPVLDTARRDALVQEALDVALASRVPQSKRVPRSVVMVAAAACLLAVGGTWWWASSERENHPPRVAISSRQANSSEVRGIREGDWLRASSEGVELQIGSSTSLSMLPQSAARVERARSKDTQLRVTSGTAVVRVTKGLPRESVKVHTPAGTVNAVNVRSSVFAVQVAASETRVTVAQGEVEVLREGAPRVEIRQHETFSDSGERGDVRPATIEDLANFSVVAVAPSGPADDIVQVVEPKSKRSRRIASKPSAEEKNASERKQRSTSPDAGVRNGPREGRTTSGPVKARKPEVEPPPISEPAVATPQTNEERAQERYVIVEKLLYDEQYRSAERELEAMIREFKATETGHLAIFELARVRERHLGDTSGAKRSYRQYLRLGTATPLHGAAMQALCRLAPDETLCAQEKR